MIADRYAPTSLFGMLGQVRRVLPMLATVGIKLPTLPADLPTTPAELHGYIRRNLYREPVAKLAEIIQLAETTCSAWLAEYEAGQPQTQPQAIEAIEEPDGSRHDAQPDPAA